MKRHIRMRDWTDKDENMAVESLGLREKEQERPNSGEALQGEMTI